MIVISAQRAGISNSSFHSDRIVHMRWRCRKPMARGALVRLQVDEVDYGHTTE